MYSSGASIVSYTTRVISRASARCCASFRPARMSHWMTGMTASWEREARRVLQGGRRSPVREEGAGALAARAVAHLRRRAVLHQAPVVEDPDPARRGAGERHLVGDDEHRHAAAP